ncbi:MAG: phosphoribosylformimino-5-aminoimidazole carboxamide ribotide isomerase [bacterium]|nr:phosphoribosylformimino-5-aminoimidazole carboxamide ribotide isomerase [bacterium]
MKFRPCIDIHNGKVKQIVGGSLTDYRDQAQENFVSKQDAKFYASLYRKLNLSGGHIILLNGAESSYYKEDLRQAKDALLSFPGGLMIGGGVNSENARQFITYGASHVIVTSYVFKDGRINYENLEKMVDAVGKEHLVLDLSCRKKGEQYYVVTDRWQKFTTEEVTYELLHQLSAYCDEFLIHAVDVEGKASGIEEEIIARLAEVNDIKVTYAGGVGCYEDIEKLKKIGKNKVDVTIGSALDLFGGELELEKVISICN